MCGLVGVINTTFSYRIDFDKFFKQALICDSVRGDHSTGMLAVTSGYIETLIKQAVTPNEFLDRADVVKALAGNNKVMMGHNRYATKGGIDDSTAHPFSHGDITLCHNGTLYSHRKLTDRFDFDVDSEAICYLISISEDVPKALEKLDGAYALTWYNSFTRTFHIARNKERKLYIAKVADVSGKGAYLYASEVGMLIWLANRNSIKIENPVLVPEGQLLTFQIDGKGEEYTTTPFTPKEVIDYDYYGRRGGVVYSSSWVAKGNVHTDKDPNIGRIVSAQMFKWEPYPQTNQEKPTGKCIGIADIGTIWIPAVFKDAALDILKSQATTVKITGKATEGVYWAQEFIETNCLPFTPTHEVSELEKSLSEMVEGMSNNKKKDFCANCDVELDDKNTFIAYAGLTYCNDCKNEYPEVIF